MTEESKNRYPGIRAFEQGEAHLFFGRKQEARRLLSVIKAKSLVVLFAKSGIGKSSLLNAGLLPILDLQLYTPFKIRLQRRDETPVNLVKEALQSFVDHEELELRTGQKADESRLWEFIRSCRFQQGEEMTVPILLFDQFEEFFDHPVESRIQLIEELADLLSERLPERIRERLRTIPRQNRTPELLAWFSPLAIKVVFSIRSDRLSLMDQLADWIPTILHNRFHLRPLSSEQARDAIVEPARLEGDFDIPPFSYQPETLETILNFLQNADGEIESFQLQLICQHIERQVKSGHG
jgi:hypothetical protein